VIRLLLALAAAAVLVFGTSASPDPSARVGEAPASGSWGWPLEGERLVVAEFRAPATRYSAGHRGLDVAAGLGTQVLAPADGVVAFAGTVVDRPLLSIDHAGDLRSTLEPVQPLVAAGDLVARGQPIGTVAAGGHCSTRCLHLGARLHGTYINPRLLLSTVPRAILLPFAAATPERSPRSPALDRRGRGRAAALHSPRDPERCNDQARPGPARRSGATGRRGDRVKKFSMRRSRAGTGETAIRLDPRRRGDQARGWAAR
jgi:murein DD-endopeptidase MepM/ murein hydrolase activator NlpD